MLEEVFAQKGVEKVVDPSPVQREVAAQPPLPSEAEALEQALRVDVLHRAACFEALDSNRDENLRQKLAECLSHETHPLVLAGKRVTDLGQAVFPGEDRERDPAGGLAVDEDDPLEALSPATVEIVHALAREVRPELGNGRLLQWLVTAHRFLRPPGEEVWSISRQRRTEGHSALSGFAVRYHGGDPTQAALRSG